MSESASEQAPEPMPRQTDNTLRPEDPPQDGLSQNPDWRPEQ